jgi:hypothetical protein
MNEPRDPGGTSFGAPPAPFLMLDRNVVQFGQLGRIATRSGTTAWGDQTVPWSVDVLEVEIRDELRESVRAVTGIATAARQGRILVGVSQEIHEEELAGRSYTRGGASDVWREVKIERIRSPLHWSHFVPWVSGRGTFADCRKRFLEMLVAWPIDRDATAIAEHLEPHERAALADIRTFQEIHRAAGGNKAADSFHLWTAIRSEALFVTADERFTNAIRHARCPHAWCAISPVEACVSFAIELEDPPVSPNAR